MRGDLFKFTNTRGQTIKGVVYGKPAAHGLGVVYLPGIVLGSTAVHRIGIELARELADAGTPVCLFDPSGVGESEGDYPAGTHQEVSAWVEAGNLVDDTLQALEFLSDHAGLRRVLLVGHCSGALTGIYAAARHPAVCGMVMICPPTTEAQDTHELDREGVAAIYVRQYLHELTSPEAWLRLVRGASRYRTMFRTTWRVVKGQVVRRLDRMPSAAEPAQGAFNQRLLHALHEAHASGQKITIVFGDRDPGFADFRAFQREHVPDGVTVRILHNTSHGFVTEDSMELLFAEVRRLVEMMGASRRVQDTTAAIQSAIADPSSSMISPCVRPERTSTSKP